MHLCVSSKYPDVYQSVCAVVESLIKQIAKEYEAHCVQYNRNFKIENIVKYENNKPKYLDLELSETLDLNAFKECELEEA